MLPSFLKYVREDSKHIVYTQHPDSIHPRELSDTLIASFGEKQFTISLRKNIYVIYVNAKAASKQSDRPHHDENSERNVATEITDQDYEQRLKDTKLAEEVLSGYRISKW